MGQRKIQNNFKFLLFFTLCYQNNYLAATLTSSSTKSLNHSYRRSKAVIANDQINVSNIKAFFSYACSNKSINFSIFKLFYHCCLKFLGESSIVLSDKNFGKYCPLIFGVQKSFDFMRRFSERTKNDRFWLFVRFITEKYSKKFRQFFKFGMLHRWLSVVDVGLELFKFRSCFHILEKVRIFLVLLVKVEIVRDIATKGINSMS